MQKKIYNSALNNVKNENQAGTCAYYGHAKYSIMTCDIVTDDLHRDYIDCDVLYTEAPFPDGFSYFNDKAEVKDQRTYDDLAKAIEGIIELQIPSYIISGKTMLKKITTDDNIRPIYLSGRGCSAFLSVFNTSDCNVASNPDIPTKSTESLISSLANNYNSLGDFMCGYGQNVIDFMEAGGKRFVASDHDSRAVGFLKKRLEDFI